MATKQKSFDGDKHQGNHTTILDAGIPLFRSLEREAWLKSIRPGYIQSKNKGGKKTLSIGRAIGGKFTERTLRLILRAHGSIQELFVQVDTVEHVTHAIERIQELAQAKIRGIEIRVKEG